jgi:uncharacterized protein (DUF488 family)
MDEAITIFTIGFTKKTAAEFFAKLQEAGVKRVVDIRLNNVSQLAGFSKRDDLRYFLKAIADIDYVHVSELAPTQDILDVFKKQKGGWAAYEAEFVKLLESRRAQDVLPREAMDHACLLCSEDEPDHCHRRLVAEYLQEHWGNVVVRHLTSDQRVIVADPGRLTECGDDPLPTRSGS